MTLFDLQLDILKAYAVILPETDRSTESHTIQTLKYMDLRDETELAKDWNAIRMGDAAILKLRLDGYFPGFDSYNLTPALDHRAKREQARRDQTVWRQAYKRIPHGAAKCSPCAGTGQYVVKVHNNVPVFGGKCYKCAGKGYQTRRDERRNEAYQAYALNRAVRSDLGI